MEPELERRFASLKRRLDALHYTETLTIECVPLVEHILNELIRTSDGFRHLKQSHEQLRKRLSASGQLDGTLHAEGEHTEDVTLTPFKTEIWGRSRIEEPRAAELEHSVKLGEQRKMVESLQSELLRMKTQSHYDSGKELAVERLTTENQRLTRETQHYQTQLEKLTIDLRLQQESERALQSQLFTLKQEVDRRSVSRAVVHDDPYALMTKMSAMDSQKRINENEIANLKFELERTVRLKNGIEGQVQFLKSEVIRVKTELEAETSSRLKLLSQNDSVYRENELLRQEASTLKNQFELQRQELMDGDRQIQDLALQLSSANDRLRTVERDYQSLSQTHVQALNQTSRIEQLNSTLSKDSRELKTLEIKYSESQRESMQLQSLLTEKEREVMELRQDCARLEQSLTIRDQDLTELRANGELLQRQNGALSQEKELYEQRSASFSKKITVLEAELKESESNVYRRQQENAALEEKVANLQRKLEQAERSAEKAEQDVKHYRGICLQLTDSEKDARAKVRSFEQRLMDVSVQSQDERSQLEKTSGALQRQQRLLEEGQDQLFKLTSQNQQLEALMTDLEATRDDLSARLDQATEQKRQAEAAAQRFELEVRSLKEQMSTREKELRQNLESTQRETRDNLYLHKIAEEQTALSQKLSETVRSKEQDLAMALDRATMLQRQLEELKDAKIAENESLQESVVRLQDEVFRLEQDRDRLKQTYESASRQERVSQQLLKTLEKEKEGLLISCKKTIEENERLSQSIGMSRSEYQEMYSKFQNYEQRFREQEELVARYRTQIQTLEGELRRRSVSIDDKQTLRRSGSSKDFSLANVYGDLEAERIKTERLEELLAQQTRENADLRDELVLATDSKAGTKGKEPLEVRQRVDEQRNEILSLEMEVMRLRDELGKAKHQQFKSDSKLREMERRTSSFHSRTDMGDPLES